MNWRVPEGLFSEPYGVFLDGPGKTLCEYWYLMNVNALAFALIRTGSPTTPNGLPGLTLRREPERNGASDRIRLQRPGLRLCRGQAVYPAEYLSSTRCSGWL